MGPCLSKNSNQSLQFNSSKKPSKPKSSFQYQICNQKAFYTENKAILRNKKSSIEIDIRIQIKMKETKNSGARYTLDFHRLLIRIKQYAITSFEITKHTKFDKSSILFFTSNLFTTNLKVFVSYENRAKHLIRHLEGSSNVRGLDVD